MAIIPLYLCAMEDSEILDLWGQLTPDEQQIVLDRLAGEDTAAA